MLFLKIIWLTRNFIQPLESFNEKTQLDKAIYLRISKAAVVDSGNYSCRVSLQGYEPTFAFKMIEVEGKRYPLVSL